MHIPDGFLSAPVWAALDAVAIPVTAFAARRAQNHLDAQAGSRIPLLGVMGAFVFAAQMVNFPVGLGTSGHLVGGALLSIAVGPAAASVVLTAILILQAFVFQDGGIIALGANMFNMAIAGVLAGYLPYRIWGQGRAGRMRSIAIFGSGFLSVATSSIFALTELVISGVPVARELLWLSLAVFTVSGIIEGVITVTAVHAIERLNPEWIRATPAAGSRAMAAVTLSAVMLVLVGTSLASAAPDAVQRLAIQSGIAEASIWKAAPFAEYQWAAFGSSWASKASAGVAGLILIFGTCVVLGRILLRRRRA